MGSKFLSTVSLFLSPLVLVAASDPTGRDPRWALDSTADYVNTEFRFYNYNTQNCLTVDGNGAVWNTGICEGSSDIFTFQIHEVDRQDETGSHFAYKVIKFYQKSTGNCLAIDGNEELVVVGCQQNNRNQEWYKFGSWQGVRLYLQIQNEGNYKCMADAENGGSGLRLFVDGCDYYKNSEWWQLEAGN